MNKEIFIGFRTEDLSKELKEKMDKKNYPGGYVCVTKAEWEEIKRLQNKNNYANKN